MKKFLKITWVFALTLSLMLGQMPVGYAEAGTHVKPDKSEYLIAEPMKVLIEGLTEAQISEQSAYIGVYMAGDKAEASTYNGIGTYISDLKDGKTYALNAPTDLGNYELRLVVTENDATALIEAVPFTVVSRPAKADSLKMSKEQYLVNEKINFVISGFSKGQIDNGAWVGIFMENDKIDASTYNGIYAYVSDLRDGKTWTFNAPNDFGNYELRFFTQNVDKEKLETVLFAKLPFSVGSNLAKAGDLNINKTAFLMNEQATVTIKGLTPGQIDDGAWAGIYLPTDEYKTSTYNGVHAYVSDLRDGKSWKFQVPSEPGEYQVRVFTKNVEGEQLELAYFGMMSFNVLNAYETTKTNTPLDWAKYKLVVVPSKTMKLVKGTSQQVSALAQPKDGSKSMLANNKVMFKSSNSKVVSVDKNGLVKAIAKGTAKITVTAGTQSINITVTVE